ncbi:hypothetical protein PoB_002477500 [Plakobranchus ocellatus]|uniref:Uncharacterized protein n=1 Tax=Plakobranchus ocellatus TaxID=259542 RepID=A0AAV3ZRA3_9GAST|nr:hypothetical protein PoB_002477500 [Plakobranchus ocellatus]
MDPFQHQGETTERGEKDVRNQLHEDSHPNGFGPDLSNDCEADDSFIPQIPEQREEEDLGLEDEDQAEEAADFNNGNVDNEEQEKEVMENYQDDAAVSHPEQDEREHSEVGESGNVEGQYTAPPQDQQWPGDSFPVDHSPQPDPSVTPQMVEPAQSEMVPSDNKNEDPPMAEAAMVAQYPVHGEAPTAQGEDAPAMTNSPAKDQRPAGSSTPRTLKEKISASESK